MPWSSAYTKPVRNFFLDRHWPLGSRARDRVNKAHWASAMHFHYRMKCRFSLRFEFSFIFITFYLASCFSVAFLNCLSLMTNPKKTNMIPRSSEGNPQPQSRIIRTNQWWGSVVTFSSWQICSTFTERVLNCFKNLNQNLQHPSMTTYNILYMPYILILLLWSSKSA